MSPVDDKVLLSKCPNVFELEELEGNLPIKRDDRRRELAQELVFVSFWSFDKFVLTRELILVSLFTEVLWLGSEKGSTKEDDLVPVYEKMKVFYRI